jgi:hypothetical protein
MTKPDPNIILTDWLKEQGHAPEEIEKIRLRLAEYDHKVLHDAIFDTIGNNASVLKRLIAEVMQDV